MRSEKHDMQQDGMRCAVFAEPLIVDLIKYDSDMVVCGSTNIFVRSCQLTAVFLKKLATADSSVSVRGCARSTTPHSLIDAPADEGIRRHAQEQASS